MLIKGNIKAFSKYNESFKSRGILVEFDDKENWFNLKGTKEELKEALKGYDIGDTIGIEVEEGEKLIRRIIKPEKSEVMAKKEETDFKSAGEVDNNLYKVIAMMNRSVQEAKEIYKTQISSNEKEWLQLGLVNIAIVIFQAWREENAENQDG